MSSEKKIDSPMEKLGFEPSGGDWMLSIPLVGGKIVTRKIDTGNKWKAEFRGPKGAYARKFGDTPEEATYKLMAELARPLMTILESGQVEKWTERMEETRKLVQKHQEQT